MMWLKGLTDHNVLCEDNILFQIFHVTNYGTGSEAETLLTNTVTDTWYVPALGAEGTTNGGNQFTQKQVWLSSTSNADYGQHYFRVKVTSDWTVATSTTVEYDVPVWVYPDCKQETVSSTGKFTWTAAQASSEGINTATNATWSGLVYKMWEPAAVYSFQEWETSLAYCIINYYIEVDGVALAIPSGGTLNATTDGLITFDASSRTITIGQVDDNSIMGTKTVTIKGKNLWSSTIVTVDFTLELIKSCKYATLSNPYDPPVSIWDDSLSTYYIETPVNQQKIPKFVTTDPTHCDADIIYDLYFDSDSSLNVNLPSQYKTTITTELGVTLGWLLPTALTSTRKIYRDRTDLTLDTYHISSTTINTDSCPGDLTGTNDPYYVWQVAKNEYSEANGISFKFQRRITIVPDCTQETITNTGKFTWTSAQITANSINTATNATWTELVYKMYEPEAVYKFDAWDTSLDWCLINYKVKVNDVLLELSLVSGVNQTSDGFIKFDNPTRTLTIGYKADNSDVGTMTIKIVGQNLYNKQSKTETFTLTKIKSCKYAPLQLKAAAPTNVFQTSIVGTLNTQYLLEYETGDTHCDADIYYDAYFDDQYLTTTSLPATYQTTVTTEHGVALGYLFPTAAPAKIYRPRTDLTLRAYYVSTTDNADQCCMYTGTNQPYYFWQTAKNEMSEFTSTSVAIQRRLRITPDCAVSTITFTGAITLSNYAIYAANQVVTVPPFTTQFECCPLTYTAQQDSSALNSNLVAFDSSALTYTFSATDNALGNIAYVMTTTATNPGAVTHSESFTMTTEKDCAFLATVTAATQTFALGASYSTHVHNLVELEIPHSLSTISDRNCPIVYALQYKEYSGSTWQDYDPGTNPAFISSYTQDGSQGLVRIRTSSDSHVGNWTLRVISKASPADKGVEAQWKYSATNELFLQINSKCVAAAFTVPANDTSWAYYVWSPQLSLTFPKFVPTWPVSATLGGSYSSASLLADCGALQYVLFKSVTDAQLYAPGSFDSAVFTLVDEAPTADPEIVVETSDPLKAGDISGITHTEYPLVLMAQFHGDTSDPSTMIWQNRAYMSFAVTVKDYCWGTKVMQNDTRTISDHVLMLRDVLRYEFYPFVDTVSLQMDGKAVDTLYPGVSAPSFDSDILPTYRCTDDSKPAEAMAYEVKLYKKIYCDNGECLEYYNNTALTFTTETLKYNALNMTLTAYAWEPYEKGEFWVTIKAYQSKYPDYPSLTVQFKISITECYIERLDLPFIANMSYSVEGGRQFQNVDYKVFKNPTTGVGWYPPCDYEVNFTSVQRVVDMWGKSSYAALPEFIEFDPHYYKIPPWYQMQTDNKTLIGTQLLVVLNVTYWDALNYDPPELKNETHIEWYLDMVQYIPDNVKPFFEKGSAAIRNRIMDFYGALEFSTGPATYDTLEVQVTMDERLKDFGTFKILKNSNDLWEVIFEITPYADFNNQDIEESEKRLEERVGTYMIGIALVDEWPHSDSPVMTKYAFQVIIKYPWGYLESKVKIVEDKEVVDEILVEEPKMYKPAKVTSSADFKFKFSIPMNITEQLLNIPFEELQEIFDIVMIPGEEQEQMQLNITNGTISEITEKSITFYLDFQSPMHISTGDTPDVMVVDVLKPELFVDKNNSQPIDPKTTHFEIILPPQVSRGLNDLRGATNSMKSGMQLFMVVQVVVASSCEPFWAMVNTLQLTLHLPAINVAIPQNAKSFNNILMQATQMELIPEEYLPSFYLWNVGSDYYGLTEDEEDELRKLHDEKKHDDENDRRRHLVTVKGLGAMDDGHDYQDGVKADNDALQKLRESGYDSKYFINNLGTICVMYLFSIFSALVIISLRQCTRACCSGTKLQKSLDDKFRNIFWNGIFRFYLEAFLDLLIASLINVQTSHGNLFQGTMHKKISDVLATVTLFYIVILPFQMLYIMKTYQEEIRMERQLWHDDNMKYRKFSEDEAYKRYPFQFKYGVLYEGQRFKHGGMRYQVVFGLRRCLFALIIVSMAETPAFQIQALTFLSLIYIIYINKVHPKEAKLQNKIECINEVLNLVMINHFYLFTDFLPDLAFQYALGWSLLFIIVVMIFFNFASVIKDFIDNCTKSREYKKQQKRYEDQMDRINKIFEENKKKKTEEKKVVHQSAEEVKGPIQDNNTFKRPEKMKFHTHGAGNPNRFAEYLSRQVQIEEFKEKLQEDSKKDPPASLMIEGKRRKFAFFQSAQKVDCKKIMDKNDLSAVDEDAPGELAQSIQSSRIQSQMQGLPSVRGHNKKSRKKPKSFYQKELEEAKSARSQTANSNNQVLNPFQITEVDLKAMQEMEEIKSEDSKNQNAEEEVKSNHSALTILTEEMVMPELDSEEEKIQEEEDVEAAIKSNERVIANRNGFTQQDLFKLQYSHKKDMRSKPATKIEKQTVEEQEVLTTLFERQEQIKQNLIKNYEASKR